MLESLESQTKERYSAHPALGSPLYRWFEAPWRDHKLPVRERLGERVFWSRAGWDCDLLQPYFHGNRIRAGMETRVTRPCWSFPGAWFQSHPTDLSEEPRPLADSNDAEGPAISICLEFLTIAASGMVVSHSTLISPSSVTVAMTILDLPAISPAKRCEVGPRGLAALP